MTRKFCPDYGALPTHLGYRPMHAWFADEKLKLTTFRDGPRYFQTAGEARQAAKDFVTAQINGRDRSEEIETPIDDALSDEVQAFLTRRDQDQVEERARVFGASGPSVIHMRGGRTVSVEVRRRRA